MAYGFGNDSFNFSYPFMQQGQQQRPNMSAGLFNTGALSDWGSGQNQWSSGLFGGNTGQSPVQAPRMMDAGPMYGSPYTQPMQAPAPTTNPAQRAGPAPTTPYQPTPEPAPTQLPNNGFGPYPTTYQGTQPPQTTPTQPAPTQPTVNPYQAPSTGAMTSAGQWGGGSTVAPPLAPMTASYLGYGTPPEGATGFDVNTMQWVY